MRTETLPFGPVDILSACRTPIGAFAGALRDVSAADLGAAAIGEAITRAGVPPQDVDDVILGCVLQAGAGMNVARQAALKAGLPVTVPAVTVNRVCGSGLQAVIQAVESIRGGYSTLIVAGGTESMSGAPYLLKSARWGYRLGHGEAADSILVDGLTCAIAGCHMGVTAEEVAARASIARPAQDEYAAESQHRTDTARTGGAFKNEIVPVVVPQKRGTATVFDTDEHPRPGTTAETLSSLRPAFREQGSVTAGNASGINDGAAALVIADHTYSSTRGLTPIARILSYAVIGIDPVMMGLGPVSAVRTALARARLDAKDIDLFEINEAFAAQAVAVQRELGLDSGRVNVNGGAIALGHPIGASGARVLTTLLYALATRGGGRGVASLCIGGGMGIAMVIQVPAATRS